MIDAGDVYLADVGGETRRQVLVVSNGRFHRLSERALVCPRMTVVPDERFPWWVDTGLGVYALDRLATLPLEVLLRQVGRIEGTELGRVRSVLGAII